MIRRVPSRNPRSSGLRGKHVLKMCLLLCVCFWLIYQMKRSHDNRKEFNENQVKGMVNTDEITKLGRKDLKPRVPVLTKNEKQEVDEDDEVEAGEEIHKEDDDDNSNNNNKHKLDQEEAEWMTAKEDEDEEDLDGESKLGIKGTGETAVHEEDERGGENKSEEEEESEEDSKKEQMKEDNDDSAGGDDDVDEHDQDKLEGEADRDEETRDEDKEVQDGEEEESDAAEREDQVLPDRESLVEDRDLDGGDQDLLDHETLVEDRDLDGGGQALDGGDQDLNGVENSHEAREEIYTADDASSAVTHDTRTLSTESENLSQDRRDENSATTDLEFMNGITTNGTGGAHGDHNQGNRQPLNPSVEVTSKGNNTVYSDISQYDGADINLVPQSHERAANGSSSVDNAEDPTHSNVPENTSESSGADENHGNSNADSKGVREERHEADHSSDSEIGQDAKESRIDLGTLPETSSDGVHDRNSASE